ncbi:hypothetical protein EIP86_008621 [Pleurotus ostreatoroseus]|nr:hypothetical protein EIP86_008621 [Pleurotus ostreatoroseus]
MPPQKKFLPAAPTDGRCLVNSLLPTELLSYIFELGTDINAGYPDYDFEDEDEEDYEDITKKNTPASGELSSACVVEEDSSSGSLHNENLHPNPQSSLFQVLASHVCKRWREVAIVNPSLWSVIEFRGGTEDLERSKVYLERAKRAALTIYIDLAIDEADRDEEEEEILSTLETAREHDLYKDLDEFLHLIQPQYQCWRVLEVMVSHYLLMHLVLETLTACPGAPVLETLQLYLYDEHVDDEHFHPAQYRQQDFVLLNGDVPRLTRVALWGVHLNWTKSTFLSNLTELELAYHAMDVRPSFRDFLRILRTSPDLESLSLCQSGPAGMPSDWLDSVVGSGVDAESTSMGSEAPLSITLPIVDLVLAFLPPDYLVALLDRISTPKVQSLALDFDNGDYKDFLRRISSPGTDGKRSLLSGVTALKVSGIWVSDSEVISKAYAEMQNLNSININFAHVETIWYDLLHQPERCRLIPNPPKVCLPKLQIFTTSGLTGEEIRNLVSERIERNCPLKEVYIDEEDDVDTEDDEWLRSHLTTLGFFENDDDEDVDEEEILFGLEDELDFSDVEDTEDETDEDDEDDEGEFEDEDVEGDDGDEAWIDME